MTQMRRNRPGSIADRGAPAAIFAAPADVLAKTIVPAASADVVTLARSPVTTRPHRVVSRTGVGAGDAKTQKGARNNACGNGTVAVRSGRCAKARRTQCQHECRGKRCLHDLPHHGILLFLTAAIVRPPDDACSEPEQALEHMNVA